MQSDEDYFWKKLSTSLLLICIISFSCKETPVGPRTPLSTSLTVEHAGVTGAWLRLQASPISAEQSVEIRRNGLTIFKSPITSSDTLILDQGLFPAHAYTYQAVRRTDSMIIYMTPPVQTTTMDTTSHNIMWEVDTLSIASASRLFDVAILSDTQLYAVGEYYVDDLNGQYDPYPYNLAIWNGKSWTRKRVEYEYSPGMYSYSLLVWLYAFNPNDIWFSNSVGWNGQSFYNIDVGIPVFYGIQAWKMWGSPNGQTCIVGNGGTIACSWDHGITWRKIESGTTVPLNDVWGGSNPYVGPQVMLIAASNKYSPGDERLLRINQAGILDSIPWPMSLRPVASVWFDDYSKIFVCGGGVHEYLGKGAWKEFTELPLILTNRIRGNAENDIFVVGDFGLVAHYNGMSWHVYPEVALADGNYESLAVRGNTVMAVGLTGSQAIATLGRR